MPTHESSREAQVLPASLEAGVRALALEDHGGSDILVLPLTITDGVGKYSEPSVSLVKRLRASAVDASYAHSSERRTFEVKKGDPASLAIAFVVGIASSAAWEALKALWSSTFGRHQTIDVTYVELEDGPRRGEAWQVKGDAESVIRAISKIRDKPEDSD